MVENEQARASLRGDGGQLTGRGVETGVIALPFRWTPCEAGLGIDFVDERVAALAVLDDRRRGATADSTDCERSFRASALTQVW
jgi:hypothetical protein